jgi:hypothetical protein
MFTDCSAAEMKQQHDFSSLNRAGKSAAPGSKLHGSTITRDEDKT